MLRTGKFLVLASELILQFAGLVQFVVETLDFSLFLAEVALSLFEQLDGLIQTGLQVQIDPLQLFYALLQLPSGIVGLLQVNDENLDFGLQAGFLLLQVVDLQQWIFVFSLLTTLSRFYDMMLVHNPKQKIVFDICICKFLFLKLTEVLFSTVPFFKNQLLKLGLAIIAR